MIRLTTKGDFSKSMSWLHRLKFNRLMGKLEEYGRMGVDALADATPVRSGLTAGSWSYKIIQTPNKIIIDWENSNRNNNIPIALLIQYGHGTGTGGYVTGIDYINPAMEPIFKGIVDDIWKEVAKL